jgi:predicted polyphosphate/ATP-dependent NAD kinase
MGGPIGLIANPASGKDIRRLVAHASVFDNAEKSNILRRLLIGAAAAGAHEFLYLPDDHNLAAAAAADLRAGVRCEPVLLCAVGDARDTTRAAALMRDAGCAVVVTLGGDGTNRAAALGWRDAPLIAVSTGTNNVFPRMVEGTIAGSAAGLVATGAVPLTEVSSICKRVEVQIEDEEPDLALIDVAVLDAAFIGTRAVWDAAALRLAVLARAEPASVGISAIGGLLAPTGDGDESGLLVELGEGGGRVLAPIAPGLFSDVAVRGVRRLAFGEAVSVEGPAMLALDGERERRLRPGQQAALTVWRDGPRVVDVTATLAWAARARAT